MDKKIELKDLYYIPDACVDALRKLARTICGKNKKSHYLKKKVGMMIKLRLSLRQRIYFENKHLTFEELEEKYLHLIERNLQYAIRYERKRLINAWQTRYDNLVNKNYEEDYNLMKMKTDQDFLNLMNEKKIIKDFYLVI